MSYEIKKAAVLGAGVMGANIAAHLTNAGIECYLLDIIPFELTEDDKKKGSNREKPGMAQPVCRKRIGRSHEIEAGKFLYQEECVNGQNRQL